jgi:hypothetical protein
MDLFRSKKQDNSENELNSNGRDHFTGEWIPKGIFVEEICTQMLTAVHRERTLDLRTRVCKVQDSNMYVKVALLNEAKIHRHISQEGCPPTIAKFQYYNDGRLYMEDVPGKSLAAILDEHGPSNITEKMVSLFIDCCISAFAWMYRGVRDTQVRSEAPPDWEAVIHGDIHAGNVVIVEPRAKLIDFGVSMKYAPRNKLLPDKKEALRIRCQHEIRNITITLLTACLKLNYHFERLPCDRKDYKDEKMVRRFTNKLNQKLVAIARNNGNILDLRDQLHQIDFVPDLDEDMVEDVDMSLDENSDAVLVHPSEVDCPTNGPEEWQDVEIAARDYWEFGRLDD